MSFYHEDWCEIWNSENCSCLSGLISDTAPKKMPTAEELNILLGATTVAAPSPLAPRYPENPEIEQKMKDSIKAIRDAHKKEKESLSYLLNLTKKVAVSMFEEQDRVQEIDLVDTVLEQSDVRSMSLISYSVQKLVIKGMLQKDHMTGYLTLGETPIA